MQGMCMGIFSLIVMVLYIFLGQQRTGCEFCLYGAQCEKGKGRLERVKELHPKRYDFIMRPVEENGLGYKVVIDYINAHSKANIRY